ncbi:MAG: hypothetical protein V7K50_05030 [Nostoc sp.]|uniref:hypothetical protein n=1 Tax=Nostoc sp. TaxID=1180 RepID=UPI002FFA6A16
MGHWALVLSVPLRGSKLRVASRREAVGATSPRVVLGIGSAELSAKRDYRLTASSS